MKRSIDVSIMGQKFQVRSDSDEGYVRKIAEYVDKKVREVLTKTKSVASTQVVILAAMNIADDFFRKVEADTKRRENVKKKIEQIVEHIDLRL